MRSVAVGIYNTGHGTLVCRDSKGAIWKCALVGSEKQGISNLESSIKRRGLTIDTKWDGKGGPF